MTQLAEVFKLNRKGLNVRRALGVAVVMLVPLIVLAGLDLDTAILGARGVDPSLATGAYPRLGR
jgi:hypothetical protein